MKQRSCPLHNAPKDSGSLVLSTCMSPVDELAPLRIGKSFMARCGAPLRGDLLTSAKRNLHFSSPPPPALGSFFRGAVCLVIADWPTRQSLRLLRLGSLPESAASNTQGTPPKSTSRVTSTSNGRRVGRGRGTDWRDDSGRAQDGAGRGGRAGNALFRAVQRRPVGARTSIRREGGTLVRQTDRQTNTASAVTVVNGARAVCVLVFVARFGCACLCRSAAEDACSGALLLLLVWVHVPSIVCSKGWLALGA